MKFNFEEEVVAGHKVTAEMKKLWAVEMDIAQKILDVCKKNDLKIWATGGTLIGAVRHHGFIPWDDDMDFVMLRDDYNKLLEIGPKQFEYPYFFQSYYTDNFWGGMVKIRRSDTAMIEQEYPIMVDFNRGVFVDILVMDTVPDNLELIKKDFLLMKFMRKCLYNYKMVNSSVFNPMTRLKHSMAKCFVKLYGADRMHEKIEKISSSFQAGPNDCVALISYYANDQFKLSEFKLRKKSYYDETIYLPFHDMEIPVPKHYHELLTDLFGDYMKPVKGASAHTNVLVDCNRSYTEVMRELRNKK